MDLGDLGEAEFARWCAEADLCANRSGRDRTGWDYLVEFPTRIHDASVPADLAPPELTCKVQVKATQKGTGFPPISLANWKRLVQAPIPAFVVVIQFDARADVVAALFLHVDDRIVREVLRRLRMLGPGARPHRVNYTPPRDWATRLDRVSGQILVQQLRAASDGNAGDYYQRKLRWLSEVGYEDARFGGTLNLSPEDGYDALVDFAIGLRDSLPVVMRELSDLRFGVPRLMEHSRGEGHLSISQPPSVMKATLQFASPDGRVMASLQTDVYSPTRLFPFIPRERTRIRFKHPFVDVIFNGATNRASFNYRFPANKRRSLSDLHAVAQVIRVLDEVRRSPIGELKLSFFFDDGVTSQASLSIRDIPELDSIVLEIEGAISAAFEVWSALNLGPTPEVEIGELLEEQHALRLVASLLGRRPFRVTNYAVSAMLRPPCRVGAPLAHRCVVGNRVVTVVGAIIGDCDGEGPDAEGFYKLKMTAPEPCLFERDCRPVNSASFDVPSALRRAVASVKDLGIRCILPEEYDEKEQC